MHQHEVDEDEITGPYEIPDLTEHAHERLSGWVIWVAIAISILGLALVIAVSK